MDFLLLLVSLFGLMITNSKISDICSIIGEGCLVVFRSRILFISKGVQIGGIQIGRISGAVLL